MTSIPPSSFALVKFYIERVTLIYGTAIRGSVEPHLHPQKNENV